MKALETIDEQIHAAEEAYARTVATLKTARDLRERLEHERHVATGRASAGDPTTGADLDRLRQAYIDARHAAQDATGTADSARATLEQLKKARPGATRAAAREQLGQVLVVRAGLAADIDAQIAVLRATIALYTASVAESVGLAKVADVGVPTHERMDDFIGRRVDQVVQSVTRRWGGSMAAAEPPLAESDATVTHPARTTLAHVTRAEASAP